MDIVEKALRKEIKGINERMGTLKEQRDRLRLENDALTTQLEQLQTDKQTYIAAMETLGYTP